MADHFKNFDELFRDERETSRPQRPAQPARRRPAQPEGQPHAARPRPAQQHAAHPHPEQPNARRSAVRPTRPQPEQTHAERPARPQPEQMHAVRPAHPQPEQTHAVRRQPAPRHEPTQEPETQQRAGRSG